MTIDPTRHAEAKAKAECNRAEHDEPTTMTEHDPFTIQHCAVWCDAVGIGAEWIPALVQALADDGPDSTMSWPTVARYVGATYTDGVEYR